MKYDFLLQVNKSPFSKIEQKQNSIIVFLFTEHTLKYTAGCLRRPQRASPQRRSRGQEGFFLFQFGVYILVGFSDIDGTR